METVVTSRTQVDAAPERVWAHLVDPHHTAALQPGVEVLRTWGTDGDVGSGYEVSAKQGPVRVRLEVRTVRARPHEELVVEHAAAGRVVATGRYALSAGPAGGTSLTVSTSATGLLARLTRRTNQRQQDRWVDRLAALVGAPPER